MKVVVAIDSLKGSLSSMEAGLAIKEGVRLAHPDADVVVKPLADGGEGTTDALIEGMGGERIDITITGPLGKQSRHIMDIWKKPRQQFWRWLPLPESFSFQRRKRIR